MKDTNNLLNYNIWSGGEYLQNINGLTSTIGTTSNNYSTIGENSFLLNNNTDITKVSTFENMPFEAGKTYTFTGVVYTKTGCRILLLTDINNNYIQIYASDKPQLFSVSYTTTSNESIIRCRINLDASNNCYLDNLKCVKN